MKKILPFLMIFVALNTPVFAGKSYSSGSSSRSSGSSSRSYSSGSSSRSYGSSSSRPSSPSGKSYSSGSSSSKSFFGGGSSSSKSYSPPVASGSSGKTYSSGSSSKPYTPSYKPASSPSGKTYSASSNNNSSPANNPGKPPKTTFNSALSTSAQKEQSKTQYRAATAPKESYKTPTGQVKSINRSSPQVQTVRNYVTHERYVTYDHRVSGFYGGYYSHPVYYNDSFSPFLFGWMLSDAVNSQQRALWMYNHQNDMDQARWNAMLAKDAQLQAEINALRAQNLVQDPSYVPPQMRDNPDVMFNKEFVDASYNPVPAEVVAPGTSFVAILFWTVVVLTIGGITIYFLAVKEY